MKNLRLAVAVLVTLAIVPCLVAQEAAAPDAAIQKKIEAYLRHLYAFGSDVKLVVGPLKESGVPGLMETSVDLTLAGNHQTAEMYVSKDGRYLIRGEIADMTKDPLVAVRSKLQTQNSPSTGPADATVTIVEFADFECPVCRQLHDAMRQLLPQYPQVRLIFKDYPLEQIHPWARTAALAGRCAYDQNPKAFWKMYDNLYDNQDIISAETVYDKVIQFAGDAGLNTAAFKACLSSPSASAAIDDSIKNAKLLEVTSTPTLFVNGRRVVGVDTATIENFIKYDLPSDKKKK